MPADRLSMRKILEVLRLHHESGQPQRSIASSVQVGATTVRDYLRRAAAAGLSWPLPEGLDEARLEQLLFPTPPPKGTSRPVPDFARVHAELRRPDVTLALVWMEYLQQHPNGYQYSQFCDLYARWSRSLRVSMRQHHKAGDKMFVDFSGGTLEVIDANTGEVRRAKLFVAVLGASSYTYVRAVLDESLPSWLSCHVSAFEFFGGVPEVVVPDNLKSGVTRAHIYEPDVNLAYTELATHYGTCVLPARSRKPKDKAKVEAGVQVAQRWILAVLRNHTFHSLKELNDAIVPLLEKLNARVMRLMRRSRKELYDALDAPALQKLPARAYEYSEWKKARVHPDYHVQFADNFYSVPFVHVGQEVFLRASGQTLEVLLHGSRVASHERLWGQWKYATVHEHMPPAHQAQADQTVPKILSWAQSIGPNTLCVMQARMADRKHAEHAVRSCYGILGLSRHYGRERLEQACIRALRFKATSYKSILSILKHRLDETGTETREDSPLPPHGNIRGGGYFH